jgi:membrane protease YdiL (CAAX protease family)
MDRPARPRDWRPLVDALVAAGSLCVFAAFVHRGGPLVLLAAGGLVVAAWTVGSSLRGTPSPRELLGLHAFSTRVAACVLAGCILGLGLGVACRLGYGHGAFPGALAPFALVAALIGGAEELVYRGYIQGRVRRWGWLGAMAVAALCHAAYKAAVFVLPPGAVEVNFAFLVGATFLGGLAFGALRELSGSVLPPLAAHVVFDVVVYGEHAQAPWWVWS